MSEKTLEEMNLKELEEAEENQKSYIFCQECADDFYYTNGGYSNDSAYLHSIQARIKEVKARLEQLKSLKSDAYGRYMYEECAERGYDAQAASDAHDAYLKYCIEIEKLSGRKEGEEECQQEPTES